MRLLVGGLGVVVLVVVGCSDSGRQSEAVQMGIERVGECLAAAGWDTDEDHVNEATSQAPAQDTYRVSFQSLDDADAFVRLAVNVESGEILAYGDEDRTILAAAGCHL